MTNYEKLTSMTLEDLAEELCEWADCDRCPGDFLCATDDRHANGMIKWLKAEATEDES